MGKQGEMWGGGMGGGGGEILQKNIIVRFYISNPVFVRGSLYPAKY